MFCDAVSMTPIIFRRKYLCGDLGARHFVTVSGLTSHTHTTPPVTTGSTACDLEKLLRGAHAFLLRARTRASRLLLGLLQVLRCQLSNQLGDVNAILCALDLQPQVEIVFEVNSDSASPLIIKTLCQIP